jgi:alpha-L-glutamate ligase-like protein
MGLMNIYKNRTKVLGLNSRFLDYIKRYNSPKGIKIAGDKIRTKKLLKKNGIPVPVLIKSIKNEKALDKLQEADLPPSFVLKPVHSNEGRGIEIFFNKKDKNWIRGNGSKVNFQEIKEMIRAILNGRYSPFNEPDIAMIEERIAPHSKFKLLTYEGGTPDIRIIIFNKVPIMSMLRIPTKESEGKANMAMGAIGASIDLGTGRLLTAVKGKKGEIAHIPHNNVEIFGFKVPYWETLLKYAVQVQELTNLGYLSVDFLIDRETGPKIVEINAKTGLSIQLADQDGLRDRMERVKGIKIRDAAHGITTGQQLFGGEVENAIENISGKTVIGVIENVTIHGKNGETESTKAKIDTGADSTSIDRKLLERLGYTETLIKYEEFMERELDEEKIKTMSIEEIRAYEKYINEKADQENLGVDHIVYVISASGSSFRPYFNLELEIRGIKFKEYCSGADRSNLKYSVIVGRKNLNSFLIDIEKK